jgi:hypothetical protein
LFFPFIFSRLAFMTGEGLKQGRWNFQSWRFGQPSFSKERDEF